jgi:hypothetical protein
VTASVWRRHRALELLVDAWPELEGDEPPTRAVLAAVLERLGSNWTLATQSEAAAGYEAAVVRGRIPTRERSWHDTFNALAFVVFPHAKAALHRRCYELQQRRAKQPPRSREEDALTLIDETSIVLAGSVAAIAELDRARMGNVLADIDRVVREHEIIVFAFGHALLEHLALGRPPIGAGVLTIPLDHEVDREQLDQALAARISAGGFPRPQLSPTLPWPDPIVESWLTRPVDRSEDMADRG